MKISKIFKKNSLPNSRKKNFFNRNLKKNFSAHTKLEEIDNRITYQENIAQAYNKISIFNKLLKSVTCLSHSHPLIKFREEYHELLEIPNPNSDVKSFLYLKNSLDQHPLFLSQISSLMNFYSKTSDEEVQNYTFVDGKNKDETNGQIVDIPTIQSMITDQLRKNCPEEYKKYEEWIKEILPTPLEIIPDTIGVPLKQVQIITHFFQSTLVEYCTNEKIKITRGGEDPRKEFIDYYQEEISDLLHEHFKK